MRAAQNQGMPATASLVTIDAAASSYWLTKQPPTPWPLLPDKNSMLQSPRLGAFHTELLHVCDRPVYNRDCRIGSPLTAASGLPGLSGRRPG